MSNYDELLSIDPQASRIQRSADLRIFCAQWHRAVSVLSDGHKLLVILEDGDGWAYQVLLARPSGYILNVWAAVPECVSLGDDNNIAIWPHFPKVTAYTITPELLALLNEHAPQPGATWLADSVTTASPKRVRVTCQQLVSNC